MWDLTDLQCSAGGTPVVASAYASIHLDPGVNVTCTFTNTEHLHSSITIVKHAVADPSPAGHPGKDFSFATSGNGLPGSFSLDDDPTDATLPSTVTYDGLVEGDFVVAENLPPLWDLTSLVCSAGGTPVPASNYASIHLDPGVNVTCTFTNTEHLHSSITIVKHAVADPSPAGHPGKDFSFATSGNGLPGSFSLDDDPTDATLPSTVTYDGLVEGDFVVAENLPPLWDLTSLVCSAGGTPVPASTYASIHLDPGVNVTCTFTNTEHLHSSITIVKHAVADPSPAGHPGKDFSFATSGNGLPGSFSLDDDPTDATLPSTVTYDGLVEGDFVVAENLPPLWDLTSLVCSAGGTPVPASNYASIHLDPGVNVTCTFTNTEHLHSSITIVDDAVPDSGQDFSFYTGGNGLPGTFSLDDDADATLPSTVTYDGLVEGDYTVGESLGTPGWELTNFVCSTGGTPDLQNGFASIHLDPGVNVTCTFTNTAPTTGSITITKDASPDNAQDFAFTTSGTGLPGSFSLDDDADPTLPNSVTFNNLAPGSYSVTESALAGWGLSNLSCSSGGVADLATRTATIDVAVGDHVNCTFTNRDRGSITILKDANPNGPQDFGFTTTGGGLPGSFSLDDDFNDAALPNSVTFNDLAPGSYSVTENALAGWALTSLDCVGGGLVDVPARTATITLTPGADVFCTFTNSATTGSITIVKDAVPNSATDFAFTTTGTGLSPFSLDDDADRDPAQPGHLRQPRSRYLHGCRRCGRRLDAHRSELRLRRVGEHGHAHRDDRSQRRRCRHLHLYEHRRQPARIDHDRQGHLAPEPTGFRVHDDGHRLVAVQPRR